jgi:hypothetical protein
VRLRTSPHQSASKGEGCIVVNVAYPTKVNSLVVFCVESASVSSEEVVKCSGKYHGRTT